MKNSAEDKCITIFQIWLEAHQETFVIGNTKREIDFLELWIPNKIRDALEQLAVGGEREYNSSTYAKRIIASDSFRVRGLIRYNIDEQLKSDADVQEDFYQSIRNYAEKYFQNGNGYRERISNEPRKKADLFWKTVLEKLKSNKGTLCQNGKISEGEIYFFIEEIDNREVRGLTDADLLYLMLQLAIFKRAKDVFKTEEQKKIQADYEEVKAKVLDTLGIFHVQGMATLYELAERAVNPNVIALYMKGQLEYYGRGPSQKRNVNEAYACYQLINTMNSQYAMAKWALADMKISYHALCRDIPDLEIKNFEKYKDYVSEDSIEALRNDGNVVFRDKKGFYIYIDEWYEEIIAELSIAAKLNCAPAKNLLGLIKRGARDTGRRNGRKFPEKFTSDLKNEEEYFESAAKGEYAFADINLFATLREKAYRYQREGKTAAEIKKICEKAYKHIVHAADLGNPNAANKVSQYLLGITQDIVAQNISSGINRGKAYQYAVRAVRYSKMMHVSYWPFYNLVKYFWLEGDEAQDILHNLREVKEFLSLAREGVDKIQKSDPEEYSKFVALLNELQDEVKKKGKKTKHK